MNRTALLEGPVLNALFGLAWPVFVVLTVQTLVSVAETYFVSSLGTSVIAGVALVFPLFMLMTMMSNGGIGGGVSAAIARAIGAGRREDADALVTHAVVIAVAFGALFTAGAWFSGPTIFRFLGAEGDTLANALLYSNVVFAAAIPGWIANVLASALRGAGNVRLPAVVTVVGALVTLLVSPLLIFGWGFVPGLGVAGAGGALILFNVGAAVVLAVYLRSTQSPVHLRATRLERRLFRDILKVGLVSAVGTIVANLTVVATTGLVGSFGRNAIAGYGLGSRLDYLLIPMLFAIGTASVTMVGTNIGAGQYGRAQKIAWTSALASAVIAGSIGLIATLFPAIWIHLFSHEADVVRVGTEYLVRVAPFYVFTGLGMALYFASQGAGKMAWPLLAGLARLAAVVLLGWYWVNVHHGSVAGLFWIAGAGHLIFGGINAYAMVTGLSWKTPAIRNRFPEPAALGIKDHILPAGAKLLGANS